MAIASPPARKTRRRPSWHWRPGDLDESGYGAFLRANVDAAEETLTARSALPTPAARRTRWRSTVHSNPARGRRAARTCGRTRRSRDRAEAETPRPRTKENAEAASQADRDHEQELPGQKSAARGNLFGPSCGARGVDAQLHEMNLVYGEQEVRNPEHPRRGTPVAGRDVICGWSGRGQARGADDLGRDSRAAPRFLQQGLRQKCYRCADADPRQVRGFAHPRRATLEPARRLRPVS